MCARFGAVEACVAACAALRAAPAGGGLLVAAAALAALCAAHGDARRALVPAGGAHVLAGLLGARGGAGDGAAAGALAAAVAAACRGSERNKLACVEAGCDRLLVGVLGDHSAHAGALQGACAALRALCTGDGELSVDEIASKAFDHARKIAKLGAPKLLLDATLAQAHAAAQAQAREQGEGEGEGEGGACAALGAAAAAADALRAVSVNDEICKTYEP